MEKLHLIPYNPHILYEIGRLVDALAKDNTKRFDVFENDIFMFFDPMDEENDDQEIEFVEEQEIDIFEKSDQIDFSNKPITKMMEIDDMGEDEDFDEEDEFNIFESFIPFDDDLINESKDEQLSIFDNLIEKLNDINEDENEPNFQHKPSDLKFYQRLGDEELYSNQEIKYRKLSNIINQCIASMGRYTKNHMIRYFYFGDDGDEHM